MKTWIYQNKRYRTKAINWDEYTGEANPIVYVPKWDKCYKLLQLGRHGNGSKLKAYIQDVYSGKQYWIEAKQLKLVEEDELTNNAVNIKYVANILFKILDKITDAYVAAYKKSKVLTNSNDILEQTQNYQLGQYAAFMNVYSWLLTGVAKIIDINDYNNYFKESQDLIKIFKANNCDIENYIQKLVICRNAHNLEEEAEIKEGMSSLLVGLQQDITVMLDYFEKYI